VLLVGLTGGIASGKSVVARRLAEVHGMPVVDLDLVAREVVEPGQPALAEIAEAFGPSVLAPDGRLDRPALAAVVFADDAARRLLNAITHPRIAARAAERVAALADHDGPVVVDSPLLVEMGSAPGYPVIVVVAAEPATQHRRLVEQRGMDPDAAWARIRSQAPLAAKLAVATHVICNDGALAALEARTDEVAADLLARAAADRG
jgi:dephospho-CoA kinase